ncbi:MAG: sulfate permease [Gammaproteobacteria bacterium]|nr:sulfate permease [Gammaproteobacteria bacterium]
MIDKLQHFLPVLEWAPKYSAVMLRRDAIAGLIVLFITVPQVIAYAFLAGLPPAAGLYAAVVALIGYAAFGSSRTLAVGPTAIIAMMTLEAASRLAEPGGAGYAVVAMQLAMVTGVLLIVLRILNFGAVISFLSHAVVTGFITAAALLIIANQLPLMIGIGSAGATDVVSLGEHLVASFESMNPVTLTISLVSVALLLWCRFALGKLLDRTGLSQAWVSSLVRSAPMYAVIGGTAIVAALSLDIHHAVAVVGALPSELPSLEVVSLSVARVQELLPSALLIAMVVFMESTSVGTVVASKRREKIEPNQELVGLGVANIGASLAGGLPVAGSFARTVVNFSSGAVTPVASLVTALLIVVTLMAFTPLFFYLPKAVLSAIIVISALQLIDVVAIRKIFAFNAIDAVTFSFTFLAVLTLGVELGIVVGILISFLLLIRASSKPHIAVVGRWEDTEHFRNVLRHDVNTSDKVLAVRIDESLYFVNTRYIETFLLNSVADSPEIEHVLLICTATNFIDSAGLEMLEELSDNLSEIGVTLHLSEVKGPVMDRLKETDFYARMKGRVFFTTDIAMRELADL